jgi:sugar phosphate isomerase/epimerase
MSAMTRRELFPAAFGFASSAALSLRANPLGWPIGCQTYPVRALIAHDFPGTLQNLSRAGFQAIELCSPVGYADSGFTPVGKYKGPELRKMLADMNLSCESCHFDINELRKDLPGRIAWANDLGLKQMIVPSLDGPKHPTLDDIKRAAEEYNKMAAQSAAAGLQQGLHNEDFELTTVDGKRTYDLLFDFLDPKLVKFQFQVSTIAQGFDAAEYFTKYPGRFFSMHVQGWSAKTRKITAVGQGTLDWTKIFPAAKVGGIKNYFVEMNLALMQASVPYLRSLQV